MQRAKFTFMSNRPFKVISERELGALNEFQRIEWRRLVSRRKRLEAAQDKLDEEANLFIDNALMDLPVENHAAATGVSFQDDGRIVQMFCECYKCQTRLQGLSPSYVVEEMIRQDRISADNVVTARKWAAEAEKHLGMNYLN